MNGDGYKDLLNTSVVNSGWSFLRASAVNTFDPFVFTGYGNQPTGLAVADA